MSDTIHLTMLTGTLTLKPVEYRVAALPPINPPWWAFWRQPQEQWGIETDFMSLGPFDTANEAQAAADYCRGVSGGGRTDAPR